MFAKNAKTNARKQKGILNAKPVVNLVRLATRNVKLSLANEKGAVLTSFHRTNAWWNIFAVKS